MNFAGKKIYKPEFLEMCTMAPKAIIERGENCWSFVDTLSELTICVPQIWPLAADHEPFNLMCGFIDKGRYIEEALKISLNEYSARFFLGRFDKAKNEFCLIDFMLVDQPEQMLDLQILVRIEYDKTMGCSGISSADVKGAYSNLLFYKNYDPSGYRLRGTQTFIFNADEFPPTRQLVRRTLRDIRSQLTNTAEVLAAFEKEKAQYALMIEQAIEAFRAGLPDHLTVCYLSSVHNDDNAAADSDGEQIDFTPFVLAQPPARLSNEGAWLDCDVAEPDKAPTVQMLPSGLDWVHNIAAYTLFEKAYWHDATGYGLCKDDLKMLRKKVENGEFPESIMKWRDPYNIPLKITSVENINPAQVEEIGKSVLKDLRKTLLF